LLRTAIADDKMPDKEEHPFVGRGGLKLLHALESFHIDPAGLVCADLGCNVGGFTDCLLIHGAASVFAVDTGYGALAWKLRQDPRVTVMERTNALHVDPPAQVDLVVIDLGWTPQSKAIPAAVRWLKPAGRIITLIKPHYETTPDEKQNLAAGVLDDIAGHQVVSRVLESLPDLGVRVISSARSPVRGGKGKRNRRGNAEWLALLEVANERT
jgi:23S rRNA (cytidine1920-2'-O)/16S rRNA (cytidine1409-2'-O)-methyltransferase